MSSTQDVRFSYGAVEEGRKLANKLWNVSRLILANAEAIEPRRASRGSVEERWILARLDATQRRDGGRPRAPSTSRTPSQSLYRVTFDDFCDWYAEAIKPRLYDRDEDARRDRARGAGAAAPTTAPGDAARDGGDLVEPARPRGDG